MVNQWGWYQNPYADHKQGWAETVTATRDGLTPVSYEIYDWEMGHNYIKVVILVQSVL